MGTECKNIAKVLAVPRKKRVPRALFLYIIKPLSTQVSGSQHVMLMFVPKGFNWSTRKHTYVERVFLSRMKRAFGSHFLCCISRCCRYYFFLSREVATLVSTMITPFSHPSYFLTSSRFPFLTTFMLSISIGFRFSNSFFEAFFPSMT